MHIEKTLKDRLLDLFKKMKNQFQLLLERKDLYLNHFILKHKITLLLLNKYYYLKSNILLHYMF